LKAIEFMLKAFGRSRAGTRLGIIACRAGRSKEIAIAWVAVIR
jgi:hypothetical protein